MYKKTIIVLIWTVLMIAGLSAQTLQYSWDFDDGTAMGWTPVGAVLPSVTEVTWYGFLPPPNNHLSNFALGMNNNGQSNHLKWEIQKEITQGYNYTLSFDYRAGGEGTFARVYAWDANWNYLGYQDVADGLAWGWAPSLNYNGGAWTHRDAAINTYNGTAKYVTIQLNHLPAWGLTLVDNITFSVSGAANLMPNSTFDTGSDGWSANPNNSSKVYWRSDLGNPGGCLAMNNQGGGDHLKWESAQIAVTDGEYYTLIFDYSTLADGVYAAIHFYDTVGGWLAVQNVSDYLAWGWAPAMTPTGGPYVTRTVMFPASVTGHTVGFVLIQFNHLAAYTETRFDNVMLLTGLPPIDQDLDENGVVDFDDFAILAGNWLKQELVGPFPDLMLDDFESYTDQTAMEETWKIYNVPGDSVLTLLTNPAQAYSGNRAIRWEYDLLGLPHFYAEIYFTFAPAVNLSLYDELRIRLNRHPGNGQEDLFYVRFFAPAGPGPEGRYADMLLSKAAGSTYSPTGWSEWVVDLHSLNNWYGSYNELADITNVGGLLFGCYTASGGGSGTIDFDSIRLVDYNASCDPENTAKGDFDGNCIVNIHDLVKFVEKWMNGL